MMRTPMGGGVERGSTLGGGGMGTARGMAHVRVCVARDVATTPSCGLGMCPLLQVMCWLYAGDCGTTTEHTHTHT